MNCSFQCKNLYSDRQGDCLAFVARWCTWRPPIARLAITKPHFELLAPQLLYFSVCLHLHVIRVEPFVDAMLKWRRKKRCATSFEALAHSLVLGERFAGLYLLTGVEWGLHFPAANGEYQSPINLNSREALYDPSLLDVRLSPNYVVCRDCEVINDGHTVRIILRSKSGDCWETFLYFISFMTTCYLF